MLQRYTLVDKNIIESMTSSPPGPSPSPPSPSPPPPAGWWERVAAKLPLDLPLALLAREMNIYLLHQASKQPIITIKGPNQGMNQGMNQLGQLQQRIFNPTQLLASSPQVGLLDYRTLHQAPNEQVKPSGESCKDKRSSNNSSSMASRLTQPCSTSAAYGVSSSVNVIGSGVNAEREALAALMGMKHSPTRAGGVDKMMNTNTFPPLQSMPIPSGSAHWPAAPSAAPSALNPVNAEMQHLAIIVQMDEALEVMALEARRLKGLCRSLVASFFTKIAESFEPCEAARALCCAWPHSILEATELLAEYETRAERSGLLVPLQRPHP